MGIFENITGFESVSKLILSQGYEFIILFVALIIILLIAVVAIIKKEKKVSPIILVVFVLVLWFAYINITSNLDSSKPSILIEIANWIGQTQFGKSFGLFQEQGWLMKKLGGLNSSEFFWNTLANAFIAGVALLVIAGISALANLGAKNWGDTEKSKISWLLWWKWGEGIFLLKYLLFILIYALATSLPILSQIISVITLRFLSESFIVRGLILGLMVGLIPGAINYYIAFKIELERKRKLAEIEGGIKGLIQAGKSIIGK